MRLTARWSNAFLQLLSWISACSLFYLIPLKHHCCPSTVNNPSNIQLIQPSCGAAIRRWVTLLPDLWPLCGGCNYDSTSIRRPLAGIRLLAEVIKVTVTQPASRSHADLFMYLYAAVQQPHIQGRDVGRRMVVARGRNDVEWESNGGWIEVESAATTALENTR